MYNGPPAAFYFQLIFKNTFKEEEVFFKEISGITMQMSIDKFTEGGIINSSFVFLLL